jgi:hypothetical protein
MKTLLLVLAAAVFVPSAAAASKEERCAKYKEQLRRLDEAKRETTDKARLHKLESRRQKVLAGQAKNKC